MKKMRKRYIFIWLFKYIDIRRTTILTTPEGNKKEKRRKIPDDHQGSGGNR